LWGWARDNKPDGNLAGLDDDDIEIAAGWTGERGKFVNALRSDAVRMLDACALHDWAEHQPWSCGESSRQSSAKFAALVKHHGTEKARELMGYATACAPQESALPPPFLKPNIEEVVEYCEQRGKGIDGEAFWHHYEARDWVLNNKKKMKNWKSAVITWEKNAKKFGPRKQERDTDKYGWV
jgi:hypothetical protein